MDIDWSKLEDEIVASAAAPASALARQDSLRSPRPTVPATSPTSAAQGSQESSPAAVLQPLSQMFANFKKRSPRRLGCEPEEVNSQWFKGAGRTG